jgi:hypothetical protein
MQNKSDATPVQSMQNKSDTTSVQSTQNKSDATPVQSMRNKSDATPVQSMRNKSDVTIVQSIQHLYTTSEKPLARPRLRWKDNTKVDRNETEYEDVGWIHLIVVNSVMNLEVP